MKGFRLQFGGQRVDLDRRWAGAPVSGPADDHCDVALPSLPPLPPHTRPPPPNPPYALRQSLYEAATTTYKATAAKSTEASSSKAPQTVTQVSEMGSLEKAPTFLSIGLEVQTPLQMKT
jgi:hypothetical protein